MYDFTYHHLLSVKAEPVDLQVNQIRKYNLFSQEDLLYGLYFDYDETIFDELNVLQDEGEHVISYILIISVLTLLPSLKNNKFQCFNPGSDRKTDVKTKDKRKKTKVVVSLCRTRFLPVFSIATPEF